MYLSCLFFFVPPASIGVNSGSYSSSSGIFLGGDSSGGGEGGSSYIDGESFGSGGGGRGGGGGGGSYLVSSVSKVRSSSAGGARRAQTAGSSGGLSPAFRERKTISSRSGGYDGKIQLRKQAVGPYNPWQRSFKKWRKRHNSRVLFVCKSKVHFFLLGSSSANSSPEFPRKDYGNYCEWECQLLWITMHSIFATAPSDICFHAFLCVF